MICKKCNTENNYFHRFCYYCGGELKKDEARNETVGNSDSEQVPVIFVRDGHMMEKAQRRVAKKRNLTIIVWILCILFSIALFLLLMRLFNVSLDNIKQDTVVVESGEVLEMSFIDLDEEGMVVEGNTAKLGVYSNADIIEVDGIMADAVPDENNQWLIDIPLKEYGENYVIVRAIAQNGESIKEQLMIFRQHSELPLVFAENQVFSTDQNFFTISGTVPLGCELEVITDLDYVIDQPKNSETFRINLQNIPVIPGIYPVTVAAFSPEYGTVSQRIDFERTLNEEQYKATSLIMTYEGIVDVLPYSEENYQFTLEGRIDEVIEYYPSQVFIFSIDNKSNQRIAVEYTGTQKIRAGQRVTIYGDYAGQEYAVESEIYSVIYGRIVEE